MKKALQPSRLQSFFRLSEKRRRAKHSPKKTKAPRREREASVNTFVEKIVSLKLPGGSGKPAAFCAGLSKLRSRRRVGLKEQRKAPNAGNTNKDIDNAA